MKHFLVTILTYMIAFSPAQALEVNGQLKNALIENSASDPVTNVIESRFYWNTTTKKAKVYNGIAWSNLGSGAGGSGEKNYISANPSGEVDTSGWNCVGDLDIVRTATAADLPRENTTGTGLKIKADENTQSVADYCYFDFTLDDIDLNRKLNVKWAQKQTGTYVASNLAVVITTQADRTTAIATPVVTNIAAADYDFNGNGFDTASTAALSLVVRATTDMATDAGVTISDVIVGPGTIVSIPPSGPVVFSPIINGLGTTTNIKWDAVRTPTGELNVIGFFRAGTVAASAASFTLPAGLTLDSNRLTSISNGQVLGTYSKTFSGSATDIFGSAPQAGVLFFNGSGLSTIFFAKQTGSNVISSINGTDVAATNDYINVRFSIPIAEWAGAPNYAGSNDVQYAFNSSLTTATDTTSFGYGPQGVAFQSFAPSGTTEVTKRVRFPYPVQVGETPELIVVENSKWISAAERGLGFGQNDAGTTRYGYQVVPVSGSTTDFDVNFFSQAFVGAAWSSFTGLNWFLKVGKAGAAVGFGAATTTASGLVSTGTQSFAGDKSFTGATNLGPSGVQIHSSKDLSVGHARRIVSSSGNSSATIDITGAELFGANGSSGTTTFGDVNGSYEIRGQCTSTGGTNTLHYVINAYIRRDVSNNIVQALQLGQQAAHPTGSGLTVAISAVSNNLRITCSGSTIIQNNVYIIQ
jgi:hypothetical protein